MPAHKGSKHHSVKLTLEQVESMRQRYKRGRTSCRKLAAIFNISKSEVHRIINNVVWAKDNPAPAGMPMGPIGAMPQTPWQYFDLD